LIERAAGQYRKRCRQVQVQARKQGAGSSREGSKAGGAGGRDRVAGRQGAVQKERGMVCPLFSAARRMRRAAPTPRCKEAAAQLRQTVMQRDAVCAKRERTIATQCAMHFCRAGATSAARHEGFSLKCRVRPEPAAAMYMLRLNSRKAPGEPPPLITTAALCVARVQPMVCPMMMLPGCLFARPCSQSAPPASKIPPPAATRRPPSATARLYSAAATEMHFVCAMVRPAIASPRSQEWYQTMPEKPATSTYERETGRPAAPAAAAERAAHVSAGRCRRRRSPGCSRKRRHRHPPQAGGSKRRAAGGE